MSRRNYGYGPYRGKSRLRTFLKFVIAVLAIVLALLAGAFFFLQQYMVVTSDGIRFELPFLTGRDETPAPSQPLVVDTPIPTIVVTQEPVPTPPPTYARMVSLPDDLLREGGGKDLSSGGLGEKLTSRYPGVAQANRLIFTMKGPDGRLRYVSRVPLAKDLRASGADTAWNDAIAAANGGSGGAPYLVAYLSCFRDDTAPYYRNSLALRSGGGNWRDGSNTRWMSPQSPDARQYVTDLCAELADMGFRELLLDNAAFPPDGNLPAITSGDRYDAETFAETVTGFYQQVRQALREHYVPQSGGEPFRLGVVADLTVLKDGANPTTGQTLDALVKYADRIYVDMAGEDPADYYEALAKAGVEKPTEFLVSLLNEPPAGDVPYSWAILPEE